MLKPLMHPYQKRAVDFITSERRVFLAMGLGMGKTRVIIEAAAKLKIKVFVMGPLRTIYSSWPEEIEKWQSDMTYAIAHGPDKLEALNSNADFILINYEGLKWMNQQKVKSWTRRMIVYDESSMCKSHSTSRFKMLKAMTTLWNQYAVCLSGTPAPNGLGDLWSQYFLLDHGAALGANISTFRRNYCNSFSFPGMNFVTYKVDSRYYEEVYQKVAPMTLRLEARDYLGMPKVTYNPVNISMPKALARKYKTLEADFFLKLDAVEVEAPNAAMLSMKLRQFVQGGLYDEDKQWHVVHDLKLRALKELVETAAGNPILCAIQFRGELKVIQAAFPGAPVIAGGTSGPDARQHIKAWNRGETPLMLCHPASLSHGVNLQSGGHTILWYGLTWSLEQYDQLNGRLDRQGQIRGVMIHQLVLKDTIDEVVLKALKNKATGQKAFLDYLKAWRDR